MNGPAIPRLVVPVSSPAGLAAAVGNGADVVVFNARTAFDSNAAARDAGFGIVGANAFAEGVERCRRAAVTARVSFVGSFPVRRFADILDMVAAVAEMGVTEVELSDPGLAAAFCDELPDIKLVFGGGPVANPVAARVIGSAGFSSICFDSSVACSDAVAISAESGVAAEIPLFGLLPFAWCSSCMAGEYFDGQPCNGSAFGPCRRVFTTEGGRSAGRLLEMGFSGGLLMLGDLVRAGIPSVRVLVSGRRASVVADVTAVFREAIDAATRALVDGGVDALKPSMYPAHALHFWNGRLVSAALFGDIVPSGMRANPCPGRAGGTVRCGPLSRAARFVEPVAVRMESSTRGGFGDRRENWDTDFDWEDA
ncbi:MAG TPA: U32 family peptidase [Myxococcota bacterium]|nr:U32 family peptidase [Myxococcota bacterium]